MNSQMRNIYCTICGKTYVDPIAAQKHSKKKHPGTNWPSLMFVPPIFIHSMNTPNPFVRCPNIPRVPSCKLCPGMRFRTNRDLKWHRKQKHVKLSKVCNPINSNVECPFCPARLSRKKKTWRRHMRRLHSSLRHPHRVTSQQTIPDVPSTQWSDDEEQLSSEFEDEESPPSDAGDHLALEDEGQSYSEDEQQQPAQEPFRCSWCPGSFLSAETLTKHTKAIHCWKCGYCLGLPPFPSVLIWREHRAMVHGIDPRNRST